METQHTLTVDLPKSSRAYVFGSFLKSPSPRDLDLLIVYDRLFCHPSKAYEMHQDFVDKLRKIVQVEVDLTLLTQEEARGSRFLQDTAAVPFELVFKVLDRSEEHTSELQS